MTPLSSGTRMRFLLVFLLLMTSFDSSSAQNFTIITYTTPIALEIGPHNLTWTFESEPYDTTPNTYTDAVQVYSIVVTGTTVGGAATCVPCNNGRLR
jgi:hypothetical protein